VSRKHEGVCSVQACSAIHMQAYLPLLKKYISVMFTSWSASDIGLLPACVPLGLCSEHVGYKLVEMAIIIIIIIFIPR